MSDETLDGEPGAAAEPELEMNPATEHDHAVAAVDGTGVLAEAPVADAAPVAPKDLGLLKEVLEALVFVHRGILLPKTAREVLGEEFTAEEIAIAFATLRDEYRERGGALTLYEVAGGWQFGTRTDLAAWIKKLDFYEHHRHLSRPTMETLAIIAYKQPVTRAEIEAIRGVNVERIVRNLLERKLVKILGHKDVPGKPMVLGTTREFLELFGLNSLADLPPLTDFVEPTPAEGIDEETPLPLFVAGVGDAGGGPGKIDNPAASTAGAIEQETDHGPEPEAADREPDTPEARDDGNEPAAGTNQAG